MGSHQAATFMVLFLACCTLGHSTKTTNPSSGTQTKVSPHNVVLPHSIVGGSNKKPHHKVAEEVSVTYTGELTVRENQKDWTITCEVVPSTANIGWKRNNAMIPELGSGEITVATSVKDGKKMSVLTFTDTKPAYEGDYTCVDGTNETHHLGIIYDVTTVVLFNKNDTVQLECPTSDDVKTYEWEKELENGEKKAVVDDMQYTPDKDKLIITTALNSNSKQADSLYGNYSCRAGNQTSLFKIVRKPVVKMEEFQNVVEEEKMHLTCAVTNIEPNLKIMWTFKDRNYTSSDGRVKLSTDTEKKLKNAVFTLENIEMDDRGDIYCYAFYHKSDLQNSNHFGVDKTFLRVKDKFAALWPFLGICAEVAILCIIILIYEKKRNKSELEESDTDQSPDTKPTPNKDSDVRQRK